MTIIPSTSFREDVETLSLYGELNCKLTEDLDPLARYEIENEDDLGASH